MYEYSVMRLYYKETSRSEIRGAEKEKRRESEQGLRGSARSPDEESGG